MKRFSIQLFVQEIVRGEQLYTTDITDSFIIIFTPWFFSPLYNHGIIELRNIAINIFLLIFFLH
jgi:hypothetical protein